MSDLATPSRGPCVAVFNLLGRLKSICRDIREREREAAGIIVELHGSGMSERKIAAEIGRSPPWVHALRSWAARGYAGTPFGPQSKEARRRRKDAQAPKRQATVIPFPTWQPDADAIAADPHAEPHTKTITDDQARRQQEDAAAAAHAAAFIELIGAENSWLVGEFLEPILAQNPFLILKILRALKLLRGVGTVMAGRR